MLRRCRAMVTAVNSREPAMTALPDTGLRALTGVLRARAARGESALSLLPDAYAAVREAARRTLGMRHHDVQVLAGAALALPAIAEVGCGEGTPLACALPAYLAALTGEPVHVVTSSDRLARRDAARMAPLLGMLGVATEAVCPGMTEGERRTAYAADVTYGTVQELGTGFLYDNTARTEDECVQRGHGLAIADETAITLIVEATTPLLVVGTEDTPSRWPAAVVTCVARLRRGVGDRDGQGDYEVDEEERTITLSDAGVRNVEDWFGIEDLYAPANAPLLSRVAAALRARELHREGRDYVVRDGAIRVLDPITGRVGDSRFGIGVHEALEAGAGVAVHEDRRPPYVTVTVHGYLGEYARLAGVTVGATDAAREVYRRAYGLEVVPVPAHRPVIRVDHPDAFHTSEEEQLATVVTEVATRHATRQPVLISTVPEERATRLSRLLEDRGIAHDLLRPRDDEHDAHVLADAGRLGAVTVVNRQAGRAMDVMLGGAGAAERAQVIERGGLCVIGTERFIEAHDARLRGWAGRRGEPGESMFVLCTADRFHPRDVAPAAFEKNLRHSEVQEERTRHFYADRRTVLARIGLRRRVRRMLDELVDELVEERLPAEPDAEDLRGLRAALAELYPVSVSLAAPAESRRRLAERIKADMHAAYDARERDVGEEVMRDLERRVLLVMMDQEWCAYLTDMEHLENGAGGRPIGARLPLEEYRLEAGLRYDTLISRVRMRSVDHLFNLLIEPPGDS